MVIIAITIKVSKYNHLVKMEGIMVIVVQIFVTSYFVMVVGIVVINLGLIIHFTLVKDQIGCFIMVKSFEVIVITFLLQSHLGLLNYH